MKVSVSNKEIIRLSAPISLALLIPQINFITNTAFLGRLGERELGVNGITGIYYLILSMIGYGLSSGMQVQMARRAGENDNKGLAQTLTNGFMLSAFFALALMMLSLWLTPVIFSYSMHNSENILLSVNFIYLRVWGLPFLMFTQLFNSFYITTNQSRVLIYGSVAATGVNILLDYTLIFGKWGMPAMGLMGAAVASIISEVIFCITMAAIFYFRRLYIQYPVLDYHHFDLKLSQRSLSVALPLIVQFMFSIGGWQIFFFFVEHLGNESLAASQILRSIFGIVGVGTWALATACNTMVSNIIGRKRQREVLPLVVKIAKLSLVFAVVMGAMLICFSHLFLSLYTNNEALITFATPSLRVIVLGTMIMSLSTVAFNGVMGTGNTLINLTIEVTCVGCYLVYCYIVIERMRSPLYIAWGAEFVYWTCLLVISSLYLKSKRWKGKNI